MDALRYELSLRVLTRERRQRVRCRVEHEKRSSISTSNHVLFCLSYKHNLLTNENKRIDNPRIKIVKIKMKNALKHCKNKHERNFQYKKFSVTDFVVNDRRNLSGTQLKSACGRPPNCRFSFSATRNANTKATEHVTFAFSLRNLVFFPF